MWIRNVRVALVFTWMLPLGNLLILSLMTRIMSNSLNENGKWSLFVLLAYYYFNIWYQGVAIISEARSTRRRWIEYEDETGLRKPVLYVCFIIFHGFFVHFFFCVHSSVLMNKVVKDFCFFILFGLFFCHFIFLSNARDDNGIFFFICNFIDIVLVFIHFH